MLLHHVEINGWCDFFSKFHFLLIHKRISISIKGPLTSGPFTSLPNAMFLDGSKFKALADAKVNVNKKQKFVLGRVENIVGEEENAGHHSPFPTMFSKGFFFTVVKSWDCVDKG